MNKKNCFFCQVPFRGRSVVTVLVICIILAFIAIGLWFRSGPNWQLTISNTNGATIITITTTNSTLQVYQVRIRGMAVARPCNGLTHDEINGSKTDGIKTLFFDETIHPGRWTVKIENINLDIMPARLVVNDKIECYPGESLELDKDQI